MRHFPAARAAADIKPKRTAPCWKALTVGRACLVLASALLGALLAPPVMGQGEGLRVSPVVLMHADMAALRGFIPAGWRSEGGLSWGDPCNSYGYNINWTAQSPDGLFGMGFFPGLGWGRGEFSPCRQTPLGSLEELLGHEAQAIWPGARMIDFRRRPDVAGGQAVPLELAGLGVSAPGISMQSWLDAGEAMFAFTGSGGQEMRGAILGSGWFSRSVLDPAASGLMIDPSLFPGLPMPALPPAQTILSGASEWSFVVWAPAGHLDLVAGEAIRKSFLPTGEWSDFILKHRAVIDGQNARGIAERADIRRQTNAEIGAMIINGYNERMAIQDRTHRETMEAVRGVETYLDTSGQPVQLDYNYRNAWQLADGSYFLTNDAGFDPNRTFNMDGRQLQAAP
ncbi:hypothetical protein MIC97_21805 [Aquamicrobium sp. NLF2-7]|uniref:hypothetical protein n=1 Tax=Aquamicrobium sp. NLF2-7 TaxID=2918753 RepID=UPI001EFC2D24|nr:hypothetical protein [Aquamicrobium sp. NLF2-7]MCG8274121.1 hypothetical protein [Aquamicrobium sp. NLF2-7]